MIPTYSVTVGGHESSGYLLGPLSLTRGRAGEGSVSPSVLSFTLDNSDGRFTPGGTGAWSADVVRGAVVTASANGVLRFTGTVESVALSWPHGVDSLATVTLTCVDASAAWGFEIESLWREWVKACHPLLWWPLTDAKAPAREAVTGDYSNRLMPKKMGGALASESLGWAEESGHPADDGESVALRIANTSTTVGVYLESVAVVDFTPSLAEVVVAVVADAPINSSLWSFINGVYYTDMFSVAGDIFAVEGGVFPDLSTFVITGITPVSGVVLAAIPSERIRGTVLRVGANMDPSNFSQVTLPTSAALCHLAIFPAPLPHDPPDGVAGLVSDKIEYLAAVILGLTLTVTVSGTEPTVAHLPHSGSSVAGMLNLWAEGTGSRWVVDPSGNVSWVSADGGASVSIAARWVSPDLAPLVDGQDRPNTVDLTQPSGATWTYSTGATPIVRGSLAGAFADAGRNRALAQWIANTPGDAVRLPSVTFDLLTIPDATAPTVAALNVGDRLTITELPDQMPADSWTGIVEGATETWGAGAWNVTYTLTPHLLTPLWTLDDATLSALDAGNKLGF